jgi:hypothetical protein
MMPTRRRSTVKFINVEDLGVTVELWPDDCLAIADALARWGDRPGNRPHVEALQAAFRAFAILGASDTNMDADTPAREWFKKTRAVWAAVDTTRTEYHKLTEEPKH